MLTIHLWRCSRLCQLRDTFPFVFPRANRCFFWRSTSQMNRQRRFRVFLSFLYIWRKRKSSSWYILIFVFFFWHFYYTLDVCIEDYCALISSHSLYALSLAYVFCIFFLLCPSCFMLFCYAFHHFLSLQLHMIFMCIFVFLFSLCCHWFWFFFLFCSCHSWMG